jgi:hypothetical protein
VRLLAKKRKKTTISSSKYRHSNWMRFLAAIGGTVSLVFHFIAIFVIITQGVGIGIIYAILGIIVDLVLLGSLNLINHKFVIEMTWLSLLILGILDGIFFLYSDAAGYGYLGTLMIVIAAFIGIFDRL